MKRSVYDVVLSWHSRMFPFLILVLFAAGFLCGRLTGTAARTEAVSGPPVKETRMGGFDFINPLLECDPAGTSVEKQLIPFRYKIQNVIDQRKKMHWITHVSVYFREMNNGNSFSIYGQEKFSPASMLKVPLLIAYLKWAESDPLLLKKTVVWNNTADMTASQNVKPLMTLERGKSYSIDDLLFRSIVYSDNNAYFLLFSRIDPNIMHRVYTDLGLEVPKVRNQDDYMSVTEYASFFRMLYNASYLNKEMSEKALQMLSEVDFRQGLLGGVPAGTVVAHKFGEKVLGPSGAIKQLHDCGIVYSPTHPYLLCVMSRGDSFEYLDDTIREISRLVYEEVDRQQRAD